MPPNASRSKLVDRLRQIARGPVAPIGFGRATEVRVPALALIVSLARNDVELAKAALNGGADAVLLHLNQERPEAGVKFGILDVESETLRAVAGASGDKPWGVDLGEGPATADEAKGLVELGADFISARAASASASLLIAEGLARVISVGRDLSPYLVRIIGEMPIEVVEVSLLDTNRSQPLTILDVMRYRQIVDLTRQSVVVRTQGIIKPDDVRALREAGVLGLILDIATVGSDPAAVEGTTRAFRQAIDQAGGPLARRATVDVIIPQVTPRMSAPEIEAPEEPEEEPDEEW